MANWQSVLAADAKFNTYRAPHFPSFKALYLRRRSQLLRSLSKFEGDTANGTSHVLIRGSTSMQGFFKNNKTQISSSIIRNLNISEKYDFSGVYHVFDQHKDAVTMIKFGHNDASLLCCSSLDGNLSICHLGEGKPNVVHILKRHTAAVSGFDWSCCNDLIVSGGIDGQIGLWSASNGKCLRMVRDQAEAQVLSCIFHPFNSNWIVAGNSVGLLQVMNISTGRYPTGGTSQVADAVTALTFDSSGNILWAGNAKGSIDSFKFDMSSGRLKKGKRMVVMEGSAPITCLSAKSWASKDRRESMLLVSCACNLLLLYRIVDGDGGLKLRKTIHVPHLTHPIRSTFSPLSAYGKGSCVVSGSEDCEVWVLDLDRDSNPVINKLQGHAAPVLSVSFNYDESHLASSDASGLIIIWK